MAIHDRDYYRSDGNAQFKAWTRTAVGIIIIASVVLWLVEIFTSDEGSPLQEVLGASANTVFGSLQIWRPFTANFVHDLEDAFHLAMNMLLLFFFGREVERMYGRRDFMALFLVAGAVAILGELAVLQLKGDTRTTVVGASGAVLALVVIFTMMDPHREILLFFFSAPVWTLCLFLVAVNLLAALIGSEKDDVARFAHLSGAAYGFLHYRFDLRLSRLWSARRWSRRVKRPRLSRTRVAVRSSAGDPGELNANETSSSPEVAAISRRIEELLEKISTEGADSLTDEEWGFLKANSERYRSPKS